MMSPFPTSENPPRPREDNEQAPLGTAPSYDELLDVAVQYTFPCSDPIAVEECCSGSQSGHPERDEGAPKGPGATPGHGEPVTLGEA